MDSLNVGINIVGIDRTVLFVNREQLRIHNIPEEEYVGKVIDAITPMSGHIHVLQTGVKYQRDDLTVRLKKPVNVRNDMSSDRGQERCIAWILRTCESVIRLSGNFA